MVRSSQEFMVGFIKGLNVANIRAHGTEIGFDHEGNGRCTYKLAHRL